MELLLIRHGRAVEPGAFAGSDAGRPLTTEGKERLRAAVAGLRTLVGDLDTVVTSPLRRARETAGIVCEAYRLTPRRLPDLAPGANPVRVTAWLADRSGSRLAVVGHEPDLGRLAAYLLTGAPADFLPLRKGAVCGLAFEGPARAGAARLRFLLTASQLGRLGRAK